MALGSAFDVKQTRAHGISMSAKLHESMADIARPMTAGRQRRIDFHQGFGRSYGRIKKLQ
jgi:hypothetical protein